MTMRRTRLFLILGLIALLPAVGALGQNQRVLVVRGGLLIDGTGADPVPNSVVVIANGKIQSVGREGSVTIPANATVIDAAGKTIIPGLVDSHVHLRNYHVQDYLYWGVTTVGDLGNSPGWLVAYRDAIAQGRMPGSYVLVGGNRFNAPLGPELVNEMNDFMTGNAGNALITDIEAAEREVEYAKKIGQDGIKMRDRLTPEMMKTIIGLAHKRGLPVFAHFDSASTRQGQPLLGTDEIVDTGLDVHVHLFGLIKATAPKAIVDRIKAGGPTQGWEQLDTSKFGPIVQKMVANKMFLNPTIANQFQTASKYLAEFDRINTQYVNSPMGQSAPIPVRDRYRTKCRPVGRRVPASRLVCEAICRRRREVDCRNRQRRRKNRDVRHYVARGNGVVQRDRCSSNENHTVGDQLGNGSLGKSKRGWNGRARQTRRPHRSQQKSPR